MRLSALLARGPLSVIVLLAASLVLSLFSLPVLAAPTESTLEVLQVGWDGTVVPGAWSPVRVRVTGGAADASARVEVILKNRYQTGGPQSPFVEQATAAYGQEVALPPGVAKELTIWVPSEGRMVGVVRLSLAGQVVSEQKVEFKAVSEAGLPLAGVLAESPALARSLSQIEMPLQGLPIPLSVARLSPADIPTDADLLDALSILVVQGNAAATLTGEQREAVRQWVEAGGYLLLAGGPEAPRAASVLPEGTLPLAFSGADSAADLDALARWAGASGEELSTGPVSRFQGSAGSLLAGSPELPLAWRLGLGQGTVTLLAVDPSLQPLASWAGTPTLLRRALEPALPTASQSEKMRYVLMAQRGNPSRLHGALQALPADAFPSWEVVALVLGGFALVVGPLLHIALQRADRRGWIWLAVPALALMLSGALYYVGIGQGGRDVLVNVVSHVKLDPESGRAQQSLAAGFYAPTRSDLVVSVAGGAPVRAYTSEGASPVYGPMGIVAAGPTEPPYYVIGGRDTRVEFAAGQWGMRVVQVDRALEGETGKISAQLGLEGGLIKGTVRNDTPFHLEDAAVTAGLSLAKLGSLAPGQTAQVALDPGPVLNPMEGAPSLSYRLFGRLISSQEAVAGTGGAVMVAPPLSSAPVSAYYVPKPGFPYGEPLVLPQEPEVLRRARLVDSTLEMPRFGPGAPTMPLTFLAFTQQQVGPEIPSAGSHPTFQLALLTQPLRLDLSPGPFTLPAGMTPSEIVEQNNRGMGFSGTDTLRWTELQSGSIIYEFRPPLPLRGKAVALTIATRQLGPAVPMKPGKEPPPAPPGAGSAWGPASARVFSIYNWQKAAWEPLPAGSESARLEPADAYVGPDGVVKVQVSAEEDHMVRFATPELMVEGMVSE